MTGKRKLILSLLIFIVLLDQISKLIVDRTMPLNYSISVIEDFFNLTYIRNTGAAFGIFAGSSAALRQPFLILFSLLAIGFIIMMLRRLPEAEKGLMVALTFILGGALGNLIDRLRFAGRVTDFLYLSAGRLHTGVFNIADMAITFGVLWLLTSWALARASLHGDA